MNNTDFQYGVLLNRILKTGVDKSDRTGTGTKSIFGFQFRHDMKDGFPILTGKKVHFKSVMLELLWFLKGDTNIKYLVDNGCNIWNGDAYKNYESNYSNWKDGYTGIDLDDPRNSTFRKFTQEEFINIIKTDDKFVEKWGELGPIYGAQWRNWGKKEGTLQDPYYTYKGLDQITNLINELKTNPDSRRLMVNAWNVGELDNMTLPPCHYGFQIYTRELSAKERTALASNGSTKLYDSIKESNYETIDADNEMYRVCDENNIPKRAISLMWNQRSVDTFLGLPFNISSYGLLLEIIAKLLNMVPDQLIGNLGDCHIYSNHIEQAKEYLRREPLETLPDLVINTEFWETESGECGTGSLSTDRFLSLLNNEGFLKSLLEEDIQLVNYNPLPAIKAPLSN